MTSTHQRVHSADFELHHLRSSVRMGIEIAGSLMKPKPVKVKKSKVKLTLECV